MRILTVCMGGRVRSRALAAALRKMGHETIAVGTLPDARIKVHPALCEWAERIAPVEHRECVDQTPDHRHSWMTSIIWDEKYAIKVVDFNLGPDVWFHPKHPQLIALIEKLLPFFKGTLT